MSLDVLLLPNIFIESFRKVTLEHRNTDRKTVLICKEQLRHKDLSGFGFALGLLAMAPNFPLRKVSSR